MLLLLLLLMLLLLYSCCSNSWRFVDDVAFGSGVDFTVAGCGMVIVLLSLLACQAMGLRRR